MTVNDPVREQWERYGIKPVIYQRHNADPTYRADLGHSNRLLERYAADDSFRALVATDPQAAREQWGLVRDPEELKVLWDGSGASLAALATDLSHSQSVRRHAAYTIEKVRMRHRYREEAGGHHPVVRAWRERQVTRSWSELGVGKAEYIVHAPFVVEFGRGCSVGCWFCGVDAPKLGEQALHTPENARLWRECLQVMTDLLGEEAARWGFCYWATDPLDNPDYESYLLDFHDLLGVFPQTTTAQAQKHVERVKKLLTLSDSHQGRIDRFSILTLRQWNDIHAAFTPEEMCFVECVPQNKEALQPGKVTAGRALRNNMRRAARGLEAPVDPAMTSTIACVSGFLLNLLDRTVRLITPCNANERWPLGYWILGHGTFTDGRSLRTLCDDLIARCLPLNVRHSARLRFRPDLKLSLLDDGIALDSPWQRRKLADVAVGELHGLASAIESGDLTASEVAYQQYEESFVPMEVTFDRLNLLFTSGLLDEQPEGAQNNLGQWVPATVGIGD